MASTSSTGTGIENKPAPTPGLQPAVTRLVKAHTNAPRQETSTSASSSAEPEPPENLNRSRVAPVSPGDAVTRACISRMEPYLGKPAL
jgi:hypothetical protein